MYTFPCAACSGCASPCSKRPHRKVILGLTQVLADGSNAYLYGLGRIGEQGPDAWQFHLADALGSVRQLADPSAGITLAQSYEPFGSVLSSQGDVGSAYGFAGEWHDPSGMVHLRARYYEPALGRFFQPVPWGGSAFDRLTQIPFVDALNDPIQVPFPHGVQ